MGCDTDSEALEVYGLVSVGVMDNPPTLGINQEVVLYFVDIPASQSAEEKKLVVLWLTYSRMLSNPADILVRAVKYES